MTTNKLVCKKCHLYNIFYNILINYRDTYISNQSFPKKKAQKERKAENSKKKIVTIKECKFIKAKYILNCIFQKGALRDPQEESIPQTVSNMTAIKPLRDYRNIKCPKARRINE